MMRARKGPHHPLGFAFGYGALNCEPIPDSEKRARAVYAALRQSERFCVFAATFKASDPAPIQQSPAPEWPAAFSARAQCRGLAVVIAGAR